ncbi:hypothetical protein Moror_16806 [Moniliophthora roreri MCA 2997]|uniref:Uncharacterized protein n=1 Tax=Moniliophthora roreri (strain MCA 2997) TaxID=1381753 RepID=V2WSG7_MONRO|nr:hypothetical protein Moror_16806 [Moniliophthora roreri MCA 2997]
MSPPLETNGRLASGFCDNSLLYCELSREELVSMQRDLQSTGMKGLMYSRSVGVTPKQHDVIPAIKVFPAW